MEIMFKKVLGAPGRAARLAEAVIGWEAVKSVDYKTFEITPVVRAWEVAVWEELEERKA